MNHLSLICTKASQKERKTDKQTQLMKTKLKMSKITQYCLIAVLSALTIVTLLNGVKGRTQSEEKPTPPPPPYAAAISSSDERPRPSNPSGNDLRAKMLGLRFVVVNGTTMIQRPDGTYLNNQKQLSSDKAEQPVEVGEQIVTTVGRPVDHVMETEESSQVKRKTEPNDYIQFPVDSPPAVLMKPAVCSGVTPDSKLCQHVSNYPAGLIDSLLRRTNISYRSVEDVLDNEIVQRGGLETETRLCKSEEVLILPESGEDMKGMPQFIINRETFKQAIRVEKCVYANNNSECAFTKSFPFQYRSECKQKYMYREMYVLNGDRLDKSHIKIPSCCECVLFSH